MNREEKAIYLHDKKFNCCQAVACAFADRLGIDEKTLFAIGEGFGFGMGAAEGTCGALSGAIMLAGLKNSDRNIDSPATKAETYKISAYIFNEFKKRAGSTICKELKGLNADKPLCSCADCIRIGAQITEEILGETNE